jgi:hypothetical protein
MGFANNTQRETSKVLRLPRKMEVIRKLAWTILPKSFVCLDGYDYNVSTFYSIGSLFVGAFLSLDWSSRH